MLKNIPCPACDGHGVISEFTEHSVMVKTCANCEGSGHIEVPMSNADRIRAMNDEELADSFTSKCLCDFIPYHSQDHCASFSSCKGCILEWLKQPAEDNHEP